MNFVQKIKAKIRQINNIYEQNIQLQNTLIKVQEVLGKIENRQLSSLNELELSTNEFRAFSQWGEDGVIQLLIRHIKIPQKIFVEFGVQNYTESNTRFLLVNNNWSGLLIEANEEDCKYIKQDPIYWQHNLKVINNFITKENINQLFSANGIQGQIGLLSIDIDGNDYWIWKEINVISPAIVIVEYNYRFGDKKAVTIPYNESFVRAQAHHSMIYYGASLKAFYLLAQEKGYTFIGCNSAGNNAFFIRKDLKPDYIKEMTVEEGYIAANFRESRDKNGNLLYLSFQEEQELISSLPLVEVE